MPRQQAASVEGNFSKALITEFSPLTFPQNACTETYNNHHRLTGDVERRLGFDFEINHSVKSIDKTDGVVNTYLWRDVSGDGNTSLVVMHVKETLYFYDGSTTEPLSAHAITDNIDLNDFSPSGAPNPATEPCQFTSGNGKLYVVHPFLNPFAVEYDSNTQTFTTTEITIKIRDLEGLDDLLDDDERPTIDYSGMSVAHKYNLLNQGWIAANLQSWDSARTDMPNNCDVMSRFKNTSDAFDTATIANVIQFSGNSLAPKGHFVLNAFDQDRSTPTGLLISNVSTGYQRPSSVAFFAGRLFYAGVNYVNFNAHLYFSQIIERPEQYGRCYQANDPTSDETFDLLATDGGVIKIQDAGTVIKMVSAPGGLLVFASNGVWLISGSTGLGFTANDYSVSKLSSINALTATSFVDVAGTPIWWNMEGIYKLEGTSQSFQVTSLTDNTIKTFYDTIPPSEKRNARGAFNQLAGVVQWVFRSTEAGDLEEYFEYDRILCLNTRTGGFYPWTIPDHDVKIHGMVVLENRGGTVALEDVTAIGGAVVTTGAGDVEVWTIGNSIVTPAFKYVVSYDASGDKFTFAEERSDTLTDWDIYGDPVDFESYFLSGYKLAGNGMTDFQNNYVNIFSDNNSKYRIQGVWDFTNHSSLSTSRKSQYQTIDTTSSTTYDTVIKRNKIRGRGKAIQFKVASVEGFDYNIKGWSVQVTLNPAP